MSRFLPQAARSPHAYPDIRHPLPAKESRAGAGQLCRPPALSKVLPWGDEGEESPEPRALPPAPPDLHSPAGTRGARSGTRAPAAPAARELVALAARGWSCHPCSAFATGRSRFPAPGWWTRRRRRGRSPPGRDVGASPGQCRLRVPAGRGRCAESHRGKLTL